VLGREVQTASKLTRIVTLGDVDNVHRPYNCEWVFAADENRISDPAQEIIQVEHRGEEEEQKAEGKPILLEVDVVFGYYLELDYLALFCLYIVFAAGSRYLRRWKLHDVGQYGCKVQSTACLPWCLSRVR
jgi:hypothetical protein